MAISKEKAKNLLNSAVQKAANSASKVAKKALHKEVALSPEQRAEKKQNLQKAFERMLSKGMEPETQEQIRKGMYHAHDVLIIRQVFNQKIDGEFKYSDDEIMDFLIFSLVICKGQIGQQELADDMLLRFLPKLGFRNKPETEKLEQALNKYFSEHPANMNLLQDIKHAVLNDVGKVEAEQMAKAFDKITEKAARAQPLKIGEKPPEGAQALSSMMGAIGKNLRG